MGLTHADMVRLLPQAVGSCPYTMDGTRISISVDAGRVTIELGVEAVRKIGLMAIPLTPVVIRWTDIDAERFRTFLARFDSYYQRGGG